MPGHGAAATGRHRTLAPSRRECLCPRGRLPIAPTPPRARSNSRTAVRRAGGSWGRSPRGWSRYHAEVGRGFGVVAVLQPDTATVGLIATAGLPVIAGIHRHSGFDRYDNVSVRRGHEVALIRPDIRKGAAEGFDFDFEPH